VNYSVYEYTNPDLYWYNAYTKAPRIYETLRAIIGHDNFILGLQLYFERYQFQNAWLPDLQNAFEDIMGENLDWFFEPWFDNAFLPHYSINDRHYDADLDRVTFTIADANGYLHEYQYQQNLTVRLYDIEDNFLKGREFIDLEDLNNKADAWRANTANVRIHGTTRERPVDRLSREKSLLKPVPWNKTDQFFKEVRRVVNVDFCVAIDKKRYSANPELIGRYVQVRLFRDHIEIWCDEKMDCRHVYTQKDRQVLPEHEALYRKMTGQSQLLKDAFLRLGEVAQTYYKGLKETRKSSAGYHMGRILKYADRYGADVVSGALAHATRYDSFSADVILRIIQGKAIKASGKKNTGKVLPNNTRSYLKSCSVEQDNPQRYDQLINRKTTDGRDE